MRCPVFPFFHGLAHSASLLQVAISKSVGHAIVAAACERAEIRRQEFTKKVFHGGGSLSKIPASEMCKVMQFVLFCRNFLRCEVCRGKCEQLRCIGKERLQTQCAIQLRSAHCNHLSSFSCKTFYTLLYLRYLKFYNLFAKCTLSLFTLCLSS